MFGAVVCVELAAYLNSRKIPGVSVVPVFFTPDGDPSTPIAASAVRESKLSSTTGMR
jgi:hypothetical protein